MLSRALGLAGQQLVNNFLLVVLRLEGLEDGSLGFLDLGLEDGVVGVGQQVTERVLEGLELFEGFML